MKTHARSFFGPVAFLSTASVALAHPGHDGHELTWDLKHLAEHPVATATWLVVFGGAVWVVARMIRARRAVRSRR